MGSLGGGPGNHIEYDDIEEDEEGWLSGLQVALIIVGFIVMGAIIALWNPLGS